MRNRVDDGFKASQDVPRGCIEDHLRAWRQVLQSLIRIGHHQPACSAGKIIGILRGVRGRGVGDFPSVN